MFSLVLLLESGQCWFQTQHQGLYFLFIHFLPTVFSLNASKNVKPHILLRIKRRLYNHLRPRRSFFVVRLICRHLSLFLIWGGNAILYMCERKAAVRRQLGESFQDSMLYPPVHERAETSQDTAVQQNTNDYRWQ